MAKYPGQIDNSSSLPPAVDNSTPVAASTVNKLREAIIAVESELGTKPAGTSGTVKARLVSIEATSVILAGDLGNTNAVPYVIGLYGNPISNTSPNLRSFLRWNGAEWAPTLDVNDFDDNLFWTFDTISPKLYQASAYLANGQALTIQSQYALADGYNGGALVLQAGNAVGPTTGTGGSINLFTGSGVNDGYINFGLDGYAAMYVAPAYAGITLVSATSGVSAFNISQDIKASGTGAQLTVQAQSTSSGTGGKLVLSSGIGTVSDGYVEFQTGGNTKLTITPTTILLNNSIININGATATFNNTTTTFNNTTTIFADTATALTITPVSLGSSSIIASKTLLLSSGAVADGYVELQANGTTKLKISQTDTIFSNTTSAIFSDTAAALTITPISAGITSITAASTTTAFIINQTSKSSGTGAQLTLQAQETLSGTGGKLVLSSGTGTASAGNIELQTGTIAKLTVSPTTTTFSDSATALTITPVSAGTTSITAASTVTAFNIEQTLGSSTGAPLSITAQSTSAGTGGQLLLTSGAGGFGGAGGSLILNTGNGSTAGSILAKTAGITRLTVSPTTTTFSDSSGTALTITPASTGTTSVVAATGVTAFNINQAIKASGTGAQFAIQAQGTSSGTGGKLTLSSGIGTVTDGYVELQTGGTTKLTINSTSSTSTSITVNSNITNFNINQDALVSGSGSTIAITGQATSSGIGGALTFMGGAGTTVGGSVTIEGGAGTTNGGDLHLAIGAGGLSDGELYIDNISLASSVSAGAGLAIPGNPRGWILLRINGVTRAIPYWTGS